LSGLIGNALPQFRLQAKDERLGASFMSMKDALLRGGSRHVPANEGYYTGFWPGNRWFIGDLGVDVSMLQGPGGRKTERICAGVASRVGFPGVTRDQYGAPLASATVVLHRTSTRELVHELVSDTGGNFLMQSVFAGEGHYLYFHKAGSVNVYGGSDNNLIGA
jgi:hypothetical protein